MRYKNEDFLLDISPLLKRLEEGEALSPEEVSKLSEVRYLKAFGWKGELPKNISQLSGLSALNLDYADVSDLSPLKGMSSLDTLYMNGTMVDDLTPLKDLCALKSLMMNQTKVSDLTPLAGLNALQNLWMDETDVEDLSSLSGLQNLQLLTMKNTKVHDLAPLSKLRSLQVLALKNTQVRDLTPLSGMNSLQRLDLSGTKVRDLSALSGMVDLQKLWLNNTQVHDLSPIASLTKIRNLDLRSCELRGIPRELSELGLRFWVDGLVLEKEVIDLRGANLSTQPISIFREGPDVIREYYDAPKTPVRESKVIFLGDGGAGKTHTMKRILANGDDTGFETDPTLGIAIQTYVAHEGEENEFKINFWDFGGQENMHAMHRCFLTERTLYVVVISNRWGLDQQARYWLDNIHSFAPKSPVILALNQWEGIREFGLDTNRLQKDYPNLVTVVPYTAKAGSRKQFETLTERIVQEAEKRDSCAMELPVQWAAVMEELRAMSEKKVDEHYKGHIDKNDYLALCEKHGLGGKKNENIRSWLLEWLNDLGVCFSYHRDKHTRAELDNYKVLEPKWLTSAIYILLNSKSKYHTNGIMTIGTIEDLLAAPKVRKMDRKDDCDYILKDVSYSEEECKYILQVMRKFGLSYQVNEKEEFIPALCGGEMPKDLHPTEYSGRISYEFRYSFLPDSVVQRLMVRLYEDKRLSMLWNQGFRIDERKDHGIVTVVDGGSRDDKLRIDIYSYGDNRGRDVMARLIDEIGQINAELNLRPEAFVIVQGRRGEFAAPADMILQAKEEKLTHLHLYSRENGLVKQNVDEILGDLYGPKLVQVAEQAAENRQIEFSRMLPQVVHNNYFYGDIYKNDTPDSLLVFLDRMAERNEQLSDAFVKHLLVKLDGSGQKGKELALDIRKNKGGALKALTTGLKALPKIATGTKVLLTDGAEAVEAAQPVIEAVKNAFATYGPEIVETVQGLIH